MSSRRTFVKVELNIETKFYDETAPNGFKPRRDPGTDPALKDEVVILGAHFVSRRRDRATDNATGSAR